MNRGTGTLQVLTYTYKLFFPVDSLSRHFAEQLGIMSRHEDCVTDEGLLIQVWITCANTDMLKQFTESVKLPKEWVEHDGEEYTKDEDPMFYLFRKKLKKWD